MLKLKLTFFFVLISFVSFLQNSTLSGSIKDSETGELLIGASVFVEKLKQGISSNLYGFYSLTIPNGNYIFARLLKNRRFKSINNAKQRTY